MALLVLLFVTTCFLAYADGANDNFKGVATLFGSGITSYRSATITTFSGSVCSIFLAEQLLKNFSGKALAPVETTSAQTSLASVALGAGITILLTALSGLPISTTHILVGGQVGAGVMAVGSQVNFAFLGNTFFIPLLVNPIIAVCLAALLYLTLRFVKNYFGITKEWCVCIGESKKFVPVSNLNNGEISHEAISQLPRLESHIDTETNCQLHYTSHVLGINLKNCWI